MRKPQPSLLLVLRASVRLKQYVMILHVLALVACLANALAVVVKWILIGFVGVHCGLTYKRLKNECWIIRHTSDAGWEVSTAGSFEPMQILGSTVITSFAIFLHFKYRNTIRHNMTIFSDALPADDYRQFIVRLKTTAK